MGFQIIVKEKGVFSNVISPTTKAKLRLLFEVAPLALLVEKAGGASSCDGKCVSGLDVEVEQHDQRTQICYGSVGEVRDSRKLCMASLSALPKLPRMSLPKCRKNNLIQKCSTIFFTGNKYKNQLKK